jgi:energy-coupling factor transport system ATP-binding protein
VAVRGGIGSGKSTLALALAGLVPCAAGSVTGAAVGEVGVVLQRPESTFLTDRVVDEVALAALSRGVGAAAAAAHARQLLARLGLQEDVAARDPLTLSGGEQRRVAIAAVLAAAPRVLVLDEPGAGLDRAARRELHAILRGLHVEGATVVLVTHDADEAAMLATRLVVLSGGRIAWDGDIAPLLARPSEANRLGIGVAPEVRLLEQVARSAGGEPTGRSASSAAATDELAALHLKIASRARTHPPALAKEPVAPRGASEPAVALPPLPDLVDARIRIAVTGIAIAAAIIVSSLLGALLVVVACAAVVRLAHIDRARVRLAVRPLVALTVLLVLLQLLVGGDETVDLRRGIPLDHPVGTALLRALQAAAIVLATLVLSAATTTLDLATALRRLLAPLGVVRIPVASLAFVLATGLGLVPAMSDELERLRLAQRARRIRRADDGLVARLRSDAAIVAPLFVAAFRRAHRLADALAVRGVDPRRPTPPWRPMRVPTSDVQLLAAGVALLVVARFA